MLLAARERLEAAIEEAILALDVLDGDADFEDGGDDEPSLCGTGMGNATLYSSDDLEEQCEDEGADNGDSEPSLSAGHGVDQTHWAKGDSTDREGDDCDSEPSLCGLTAEVPYGRIEMPSGEIVFGDRDLEVSCEDEGAITGDDEPDAPDHVLPYADGGHDQTRIISAVIFGQQMHQGVG